MPHDDHEDKEYEDKPENKDLKIKGIHIKILDDGSYLYQAMADADEGGGIACREYSLDGVEDVVKAVEDDLSSPHLKKAFKEVNENEPKIVKHTREKYGKEKANKQKVAIAFNKSKKNPKVFGRSND